MKRLAFALLLSAAVLSQHNAFAQERPYGRGLTEQNKERLVLDDMENISGWSNQSPAETKLEASALHVKQGQYALKFGNVVDHTQGEKNYPIGWPRTARSLAKTKLTDWSGYDFFECWIYVDTSREALPSSALGISFAHPGHRVSTHVALKQVKKDQWVKIIIPIASLQNPREVQGIQFNISESNYKHGDRVDFYIDDVVLTRYTDPTVADLAADRKILFSGERELAVNYTMMGHKDLEHTTTALQIGTSQSPVAQATAPAQRRGEITLPLKDRLAPGDYWARLSLRDAQGKLIDRRETSFRVIPGPF